MCCHCASVWGNLPTNLGSPTYQFDGRRVLIKLSRPTATTKIDRIGCRVCHGSGFVYFGYGGFGVDALIPIAIDISLFTTPSYYCTRQKNAGTIAQGWRPQSTKDPPTLASMSVFTLLSGLYVPRCWLIDCPGIGTWLLIRDIL